MLKRLLLLSIAATLLLMAGETQETSTAQTEDRIIIGTLDLPTVLDPATADTFMEWEVLSHLYVGLTRQVPGTTTYELATATDYSVSSDGLTHTFVLRDDLTFADGSPYDALTYERSIRRVLALNAGGASLMNDVVEDVVAIDEQTLQFTLSEAVPYFDALVALPPFFAVSSDDFPSGRVSETQTSLNGNGVYRLLNWDPGDLLVLEPNPNYQFGEGAQNNGVELRIYPDTESLRVALIGGEVDVAWRDVRLPDAVATSNDSDGELVLTTTPSVRMWYLFLNTLCENMNQDPILREVFVNMLDRELVTESYFDGYLTPSYSLVPELVGDSHSPIYTSYDDSQQALDVLEENDYSPNRPEIIAIFSSEQLYGSYYAGAVSSLRVGLTATNRYINVNTSVNLVASAFIERMTEGEWCAPVFAWTPVVPHTDAYLRPLLHSESSLGRANNYSMSQVDVVLNQARRTQDVDEQNAAYLEAQALIQPTNTIVPLWQDTLSILHSSSISGVTLSPNYFLHYDLLVQE